MKIKFPDTGQIIEVTEHSQLANTKVRVTPETSRQIQEAIFKIDFEWADGDKNIHHVTMGYLFLADPRIGNRCLQVGDDPQWFKCHSAREFEFISPLEEPQPAGQEDNGWVSCQDRLPEVGSWVIGWSDRRESMHVFLDSASHEEYDGAPLWLGMEGDLMDEENITHWMPRPPAPKTLNS